MDQREKNLQIAESIENAKKTAVIPSMTGYDAFCGAVGLYFMLKDKGKEVDFLFQGDIPEGLNEIISINDIKRNEATKELVVSIDYSKYPLAKAQYSTNNGVLFIKLGPVSQQFDISQVQTEMHAISQDYDLLFSVGAQITEDMGQAYKELKQDPVRTKLVNIDIDEKNLKYGNYNIVEGSEGSICLLVLNLSRFWRLKLTHKSAKAFLSGISHKMG